MTTDRSLRRFILLIVVLEQSTCLFVTAKHKKIKRLRKGNAYLKNPFDIFPAVDPEDLVEVGLTFGYTIRYDDDAISEVRRKQQNIRLWLHNICLR
jgi:hypothetical protein